MVNRIRERIDRNLLDGVETELKVGGAGVVEVQERVVGIKAINREIRGGGRKAVEFHVAVPASRVHNRPRGDLRHVAQVHARVWKRLNQLRSDRGGRVWSRSLHQRCCRSDLHNLSGRSQLQLEVEVQGL